MPAGSDQRSGHAKQEEPTCNQVDRHHARSRDAPVGDSGDDVDGNLEQKFGRAAENDDTRAPRDAITVQIALGLRVELCSRVHRRDYQAHVDEASHGTTTHAFDVDSRRLAPASGARLPPNAGPDFAFGVCADEIVCGLKLRCAASQDGSVGSRATIDKRSQRVPQRREIHCDRGDASTRNTSGSPN